MREVAPGRKEIYDNVLLLAVEELLKNRPIHMPDQWDQIAFISHGIAASVAIQYPEYMLLCSTSF